MGFCAPRVRCQQSSENSSAAPLVSLFLSLLVFLPEGQLQKLTSPLLPSFICIYANGCGGRATWRSYHDVTTSPSLGDHSGQHSWFSGGKSQELRQGLFNELSPFHCLINSKYVRTTGSSSFSTCISMLLAQPRDRELVSALSAQMRVRESGGTSLARKRQRL